MSRNLILAGLTVIFVGLGTYLAVGYFSQSSDATIGSVLKDNGFTEFRPASKHVPPGSLVLVAKSEPLSLSLICGVEASLGLSFDEIPSSPTIATEISSVLDRNLTLDAQLMSVIKSNGSLEDVTEINLKLSNVRVLEISDELVIDQLANRTASCREAIRQRLAGENVVTMVSSALVADVTYTATLKTQGNAEITADIQDDLAASLGSKVSAVDGGAVTLVGHDLIWGIRDDAFLARYGSTGLPSTGGPQEPQGSQEPPDDSSVTPTMEGSEDQRRALPPSTTVINVEIDQQARLEVPPEYKVVRHNVHPLQQVGRMDCWATVFTMIASWKDRTNYQVVDIMEELGGEYLTYWRQNTGLPGGKELEFVARAGMTAKPPANYFLKSYVSMLNNHGPLWIITGDGISSHAKLLVGVFGPKFEEDSESYRSAIFEFIDPATGLYSYQSALDFMTEFEQEARHILDTHQDDTELRWQILHL